ncbi:MULTISPECIES: extradiol ring-cleavage dioxygenase [Paenibacillus]|uniref:Subunit LigB of aromatic ring-opening dioxygenase n=1 Tax=Paenibacillus naphthalenovorans TaxID=162209 RepID=A0A0U2M0P1_9BACL|nr:MULTISPECIES: extradiol ring-cleavage dioxygenase [Paenibacillus]ALS20464.1 subunit LigB of aromatic ring-opening dioxygenase [Paenibacillus naphthalenovorans]NTZ18099.1 extradiol ring-cleavage dioxygenase [Paenibacillus sp. JMULE4]GCL73034.1 extradiol ring-cleavage dioxygenase [Paenibacillus naphthalenovorans]SDI69477.1 3,4-dihydroxyphenylacetate 2,3-dioxygenase [Paenibacillus naphthalenovorans]
MSIELGLLVPHTPRMCHEEQAPAFQKELVRSMHEAADVIASLKPDVIVLISCHWMSSFHHLVDATPHHKGILTAFECPELISDVPYEYPGDEQLGSRLVEAGQQAGLSVVKVNDPTYVWDYGTVVPLRYLVPKGDIPVIDLSVTWAANLEETYQWGQQVGKVLRESEKRAVFVSSGALSHNLVRGPEVMPSISEQALDKQFLDYLNHNDLQSAWKMLPQYAKAASVESGGRHLAMLLGVLEGNYTSKYYGYGQSSASANVVMTFQPGSTESAHITA